MRLLALACSLGSASAYTTAPSFQASGSKHSFSLVSDIYVPPEPREDCKGVSAATSDDWCSTSCVMDPPNCPASLCECEGGNPGAKLETESENSERKRMAEIYENERKAEETREVSEAQRVQEPPLLQLQPRHSGRRRRMGWRRLGGVVMVARERQRHVVGLVVG